MARDYDNSLTQARWEENRAIRTRQTLEGMKPKRVYLITNHTAERLLAFPRGYLGGDVKLEVLAHDRGFNVGWRTIVCLGYANLSDPDCFTFRRVPKNELPLYLTMDNICPGLEKALKGMIRIEED